MVLIQIYNSDLYPSPTKNCTFLMKKDISAVHNKTAKNTAYNLELYFIMAIFAMSFGRSTLSATSIR